MQTKSTWAEPLAVTSLNRLIILGSNQSRCYGDPQICFLFFSFQVCVWVFFYFSVRIKFILNAATTCTHQYADTHTERETDWYTTIQEIVNARMYKCGEHVWYWCCMCMFAYSFTIYTKFFLDSTIHGQYTQSDQFTRNTSAHHIWIEQSGQSINKSVYVCWMYKQKHRENKRTRERKRKRGKCHVCLN